MLFNNEIENDYIDLDKLAEEIIVADANQYISNPDKAVNLISNLIQNESTNDTKSIKKINDLLEELFSLLSTVSVGDELEIYDEFKKLVSRLEERKKVNHIAHKSVISFGGKFSAGKSRFINAIAKSDDLLPVDQVPTTSIPTYIVDSREDKITANSIYGYTTELSREALKAMTHEFYDTYKIGFSAFVDSIIVESKDFFLGKEITLLDTPGYTKADNKSKAVESDREKAYAQLRASDYLIWLIDIENGGITEDDIEFMEKLKMSTDILIVFTKADLKPQKIIKEIIEQSKKTLKNTTISYYDVTAFSSQQNKEYGNDAIDRFLDEIKDKGKRKQNFKDEFRYIQDILRQNIVDLEIDSRLNQDSMLDYIRKSKNIMHIRAAAKHWSEESKEYYKIYELLKDYDRLIRKMNKEINNIM